jgi:hypothetical protein
MSYTVKVTATKPENTKWFFEVNPASAEAYKNYLKTVPGLTKTVVTRPDANTHVRTYVFESEQAYMSAKQKLSGNQESAERSAYNAANGITIITEIIS